MIDLSNVSIAFKELKIDYNDHAFKGKKITFIIGPNGTGKTSLLKAVAGLLEFNGEITTDGVITYNSQSPVLFNMSVYDNITYPLRIRKLELSKYKEQILDYCEQLDLTHLLEKNALKLSSGEKMKVSILRSIIFNPDVLLLDEPTTALDVKSIKELTGLLRSLKTKMMIIIVSHDRLFIEELNDELYQLGEQNV